jgi:hypothetical protein
MLADMVFSADRLGLRRGETDRQTGRERERKRERQREEERGVRMRRRRRRRKMHEEEIHTSHVDAIQRPQHTLTFE